MLSPQDPDDRTPPTTDAPAASEPVSRRNLKDETRNKDGGGSFFDGPMEEDLSLPGESAAMGRRHGEAVCSDRAELIERLKRGESPQWIPNQSVSLRGMAACSYILGCLGRLSRHGREIVTT